MVTPIDGDGILGWRCGKVNARDAFALAASLPQPEDPAPVLKGWQGVAGGTAPGPWPATWVRIGAFAVANSLQCSLPAARLQGLRRLEPEGEDGPDLRGNALLVLDGAVSFLRDWPGGVAMLAWPDGLRKPPARFVAGARPEMTGCLTTPMVGCWLVSSLLFSCPV